MTTMRTTGDSRTVAVPWVSVIPPEIWGMIGQQIRNQKTRDDLARVCHTFRGLFLPLARENLLLRFHRYDIDALDKIPPLSGTENVKVLSIKLLEFRTVPNGRYRIDPWPQRWNTVMANFIASMISSMLNLCTFRFSGGAMWADEGPSKILQDPKLMRTLEQHEKLKMIYFNLDYMLMEQPTPDIGSVKLDGFRNLTSLEVYKFQGPDNKFIDDLTTTLGNSPLLTKLGLGKEINTDLSDFEEMVFLEGDPCLLEKLCSKLAARGICPLPIQTLRLGVYFTPYKSSSESGENYLAKLISLEGLRNLHVWNGRYTTPTDEEEEQTEIHWPLFDACRAVRNFQITLLTQEVLNWLNDKQSVQELILTDHYDCQNEAFRNISQLRIPRLSMLLLRDNVHAPNAHLPIDDGGAEQEAEWSESDGSAVFACSLFDAGEELVQRRSSLTNNPSEPGSSQVMRSQTLVVGINKNKLNSKPLFDCQQFTSILDRIPHRLQHLEKLGISLNLETQFWRFSHRLLAMPKLTHLRLERRYLSQYPPKSASYWPGIDEPREIALQYVKIMKNICPSLQYVNIGKYLWQIIPRWSSEISFWDGFEFLEIDEDEKLKIELFAFEIFAVQSGLLGGIIPTNG
ncbi:hypothetical protein BJ875DRAFT_511825 [Amylocarpus encephaloides]|uniref:Uncharacterized protein n=1 Tax=Amylocarpus encephaloides TaxID=45428 RepID=A0A9P7YIF8_9HELO|nr:hypothetical protein BJ875DRAFT_511825 [Amylocarpus encephaloides]